MRAPRLLPVALLVAVAAAASWHVVRDASERPDPDAPTVTASPDACADGGSAPCTDLAAVADAGPPADVRRWIPAAEACGDAGYLCAPLQEADSTLVLHFPPGTGTLRIRIPPPPNEEPAVARRLQRAASRGIQAWQGHPFQLRILERDRDEPADITVRWAPRVEGGALGRTSLRYRSGPGGTEYRVVALRLATRIPSRPDRTPESRALELTAAHEMGHALGLPHSDDRRDLMYPTNTATHPTARDYRTLQALYGIPSGTGIVRD